MLRHPCHCQVGIVALVTMVLLPLICNSVAALSVMALLPSSSWHCCPFYNGVVVVIDVVALVAHCQVGIVTLVVMVLLPSICRCLCFCYNGNCCSCHNGVLAVVNAQVAPPLLS
jgi:hypothetical protein